MKKLILVALLVLLLLPLFQGVCCAEGLYDRAASLFDLSPVEEGLSQSDREISGSFRYDGSYDAQGALARLWTRVLDALREGLERELRFASGLLGVALLCALAAALCGRKDMATYIELAGCCAVALLMAGGTETVIGQARTVLAQLSDYSKAAMPVIYTAAAASGAPGSAAARYAACSLALDVLMSLSGRLILPLIYAFISVTVCASVFENSILRGLAKALKWGATMAMTAMTLCFSAYIGITGVVTGSADALAVKTARTLISSTLPVVGGIISDSASLVLSAASVIRNAAGVFSLIAVCAMCAEPFALLSVKMLLYKAAAAGADMLPLGRMSRLIGDFGTAFALLLGMVGSFAIMLFISIMAAIKAVAA